MSTDNVKVPEIREVRAGIKINGVLQRDSAWLETRIELLEKKKEEYKTRIKNIDAEIKERKAQLKTQEE